MSVPQNQSGSYVSTVQIPADYLAPADKLPNSSLLDFEQGAAGLNDPSLGLNYQIWTLYYSSPDVMIDAPNQGSPTVLFSRSGISELSLTFDQNMNPFVAFVENGIARFWWYDSDLPGVTFTDLPSGSLTPRCCLDDRRDYQDFANDIILCYVHNGALKMRVQRERYLTEHIVQDPFNHPDSGAPALLKKVAMHDIYRLQWTGATAL